MKIYKKLPHINSLDHYQFITIRTHDSLDNYLKKIDSFDLSNAQKQMQIDNYLDTSVAGRYFQGEVLRYFRDFLLSFDNRLFELVAFSIMPNHLHILFYQKDDLSKIMKLLKGSSSSKINKLLNKKGKFWASSYYDKAIRDEKHFEVVYNYILNNPKKASLKDVGIRVYSRYEN